ncbi:hypothetical protein F2P81_002054 [Scophthalmus maximus]|uniref:TNFR-Cys domain-containing protein n=1 Tax=Scophthalmus maximus TaxID=52904 RepID=A0A6A4TJZ7_SCOMX|nr:hypothetical protein F2P81_002054 [Scophthalmus maximus]
MHVQADCDGTKETQCDKCAHGFYTATKNHLTSCQLCKECSSDNNQRKAKECTATANTVCECESGFYCSNDLCDHCQPVTDCLVGEGVKVPATRTNDTVCAPCEEGTYSNVTDFLSPCKTHTRCDDLGREVRILGTRTTNAVCSDILPRCSWMLPAGLWSGLVLSALVLLAVVVCWRAKRKSCGAVYEFKNMKSSAAYVDEVGMSVVTTERCHLMPNGFQIRYKLLICSTHSPTVYYNYKRHLCEHDAEQSYFVVFSVKARSSVPATLVEMFPAALVTSRDLPLPLTERNGHYQETCAVDDCKLPIFNMDDDDNLVSCCMDSSLPITPLKASVSFAESNHNTGNTGHRTGNFLRTYSEPQEDEWCGT